MAKTLASFSKDIRTYLGKGKVRQARKAIDKASKAGVEGIAELEMEVRLAEGNPEGAAEVLRGLAADESLRLAAPLKTADLHLRKNPKDIAFRDAVWEAALSRDQFDLATRQLSTLVGVEGFDPGARAQALLGRKDAVGATGIFMLATFGGITTDRIKLADRLLGNEQGSELLSGVVGSLQKRGVDDDYVQPGNLYRLLPPDEQERLIVNIVGSLVNVSKELQEKMVAHFRRADAAYGDGIAKALGLS